MGISCSLKQYTIFQDKQVTLTSLIMGLLLIGPWSQGADLSSLDYNLCPGTLKEKTHN